MKILKAIKDLYERKRLLGCLVLFLTGFIIGHVLYRIAYLICFFVMS